MKIRNTITLAIGVGVLSATLAACGPDKSTAAPAPAVTITVAPSATIAPTPSASPTPTDPQTYDGAKAAVARMESELVKGNDGAFWDDLTASGKLLMSRTDYIWLTAHCKGINTADEPMISISMNDANTIGTVTSAIPKSQGGGTFQWQLVYERGHWKHAPSSGLAEWMSLSRSKALAYLEAGGAC